MVGADGVSRRSCGAMWGGRERNGQEWEDYYFIRWNTIVGVMVLSRGEMVSIRSML
jgi:hypothetical protein